MTVRENPLRCRRRHRRVASTAGFGQVEILLRTCANPPRRHPRRQPLARQRVAQRLRSAGPASLRPRPLAGRVVVEQARPRARGAQIRPHCRRPRRASREALQRLPEMWKGDTKSSIRAFSGQFRQPAVEQIRRNARRRRDICRRGRRNTSASRARSRDSVRSRSVLEHEGSMPVRSGSVSDRVASEALEPVRRPSVNGELGTKRSRAAATPARRGISAPCRLRRIVKIHLVVRCAASCRGRACRPSACSSADLVGPLGMTAARRGSCMENAEAEEAEAQFVADCLDCCRCRAASAQVSCRCRAARGQFQLAAAPG